MAQLKAGSTVGGNTIATEGPAVVPVNSLTILGTKEFGKYVLTKNNQLQYDNYKEPTLAFTAGGTALPYAIGPESSVIDKFPFTAPFTTATSAGSLSQARESLTSSSSFTEGFCVAGYTTTTVSTIDKFPFTAPFTTATSVGTLAPNRYIAAGQSSPVFGFSSGGSAPFQPGYHNSITKFPMVSPFTSSTSAGTLTSPVTYVTGHSSPTDGFSSGGTTFSTGTTASIEKFPFNSSFTTATSAGSLSQARHWLTGHSSPTEGFTSGGQGPTPAYVGTTDKFPFTAPFTTATSVGNLSQNKVAAAGQASFTEGFSCGGTSPDFNPPAISGAILKFPFAAPFITSTTAGDLSQIRYAATGLSY